jgi:hypothetical protein
MEDEAEDLLLKYFLMKVFQIIISAWVQFYLDGQMLPWGVSINCVWKMQDKRNKL